jgi:CheY-like chemotaxis protein
VLAAEQWQVTVVADAGELQAQLARGVPTLAFVDAMMPGKLNFVRAFDALKAGSSDCRVVVTTGTATDYQLAEYIRAASARLIKPLTEPQVREFLAGRRESTLPA